MNSKMTLRAGGAALAFFAISGCATPPVQPIPRPAPQPAPAPPPPDKTVDATIVGGEAPVPGIEHTTGDPNRKPRTRATGTVELTIPSVDVRTLAQIVLHDTLRIPYSMAVDGDVMVSLATAGPVTHGQLLELFEASLRKADLAMVWQGGGYKIESLAAAKAEESGFLADRGFATEAVTLRFANAEELRKLLDSIVPGTVESVDPARNTLVLAGTQGQRKGAHDIINQFDVDWLRSMSFALFVPQSTDSRLIVPELDKLINAPDAPTRGLVRLIAMEKLNGIIAISAQKQYLEDVRRWVEVLDREGTSAEARVFVYRVQNGRSKDLVKTINTTFGISANGTNGGDGSADTSPAGGDAQGIEPIPQRTPVGTGAAAGARSSQPGPVAKPPLAVRISSDEVNNAVVVYASAHDYAIIGDALRKLDVTPVQVLIEAAITEVDLNDSLQYGVQWNFTNFANGTSANSAKLTVPSTSAAATGGFSYFLSRGDISATLSALQDKTNVKVVSAPKLMVLNNQTAALQIGDEVPIETQSSLSSVGSSQVISSIEYKDTGVILKITPRVNASGTVLLDVSQEVSQVSTTTTSGIDSPTISTRKVSTTIAVQDGQVVALGGMFSNTRQTQRSGVPFLSQIPVLGGLLFGQTAHSNVKTELIVLIKPHVLRSPADVAGITEELRDKITTVEPFRTRGTIP